MRILILLLLSGIGFSTVAQSIIFGNKTKIYLVRHAEKLPGDDPLLTLDGNKRAGDLMRVMKNKPIKRIYVTEYKRTQNTADSLRIQLGIDTVQYLSDTSCTDLFKKISANDDLNNSLIIIGHSNTIPSIIRKLGIANYTVDEIPATEFDNLFIISHKKGRSSLKKVKYGAISGVSAIMQ